MGINNVNEIDKLDQQETRERNCPFSRVLQEDLSEQLNPVSAQDYATPILSQADDITERYHDAEEMNNQIRL